MNMFELLPTDIQDALTTGAGVVCGTFDPEGELTEETIRQSLLFATSGGTSIVCTPTRKDLGEGIDNCPPNSKELLKNERYECKMSGTAKTIKEDTVADFTGSADVTKGLKATKIKPRMEIKETDFKDRWLICPYGTKGGFVAFCLKNAIASGLSGKSENKDSGSYEFEYDGHPSLKTPDEIPFEVYIRPDSAAAAAKVKV